MKRVVPYKGYYEELNNKSTVQIQCLTHSGCIVVLNDDAGDATAGNFPSQNEFFVH